MKIEFDSNELELIQKHEILKLNHLEALLQNVLGQVLPVLQDYLSKLAMNRPIPPYMPPIEPKPTVPPK